MRTVWDACQRTETLATECNGLFQPASLEEAAQLKQPSREEFLKQHNLQAAPAMSPRVEATPFEMHRRQSPISTDIFPNGKSLNTRFYSPDQSLFPRRPFKVCFDFDASALMGGTML